MSTFISGRLHEISAQFLIFCFFKSLYPIQDASRLPASGLKLKSGDQIQVTIQHADARRGELTLFAV
ncbi:hypothetical protein [Desulfobacter sp.]|uniref:hypothetical protein n=1 Tax=Desulfobacter sp. TaxID=2294 RepID=UPI003D111746